MKANLRGITVVIVARNAVNFVNGAIHSALNASGAKELLFLDDCSVDGTYQAVYDRFKDEIRCVQSGFHTTLGSARRRALEMVTTPYLMWLDADDTIRSDRIARADNAFKGGYSVYVDGAEIIGKDHTMKALHIPPFISSETSCRLFERNYLPVTGPIAISTELARTVGYDDTFETAEDYDFWLRLLRLNPQIYFDKRICYAIHERPDSISRNVVRQNEFVSKALNKHTYEDVEAMYKKAGFDNRVTNWGMCSMALFRRDFSSAENFLELACPTDVNPHEVLEPTGPNPIVEGWRYSFTKGTLQLLNGDAYEAIQNFESAHEFSQKAESFNNMGVAYRMIGDTKSTQCFMKAVSLYPEYLDAKNNIELENNRCITTHPLRMNPIRPNYIQ